MYVWAKSPRKLFFAVLISAGLLGLGLPADVGAQATSSTMTGEPVQSQTLLGQNLSLQVGYKVWLAKWQTWSGLSASQGANQMISKFEPMMGPQITLTAFNRVFLSGQYLNSSFGFFDSGTSNQGVKAIRNDLTLTTGVRVWQGFGIFAGYYQMLQHFTDPPPNFAFRIKGPIIGLFGTVPVEDTPWALYGNVATGWMSFHPTGGAANPVLRTDNVRAYSGEVGVNYTGPTIWKVGTSAQVGWRYQVLEQRFGAGVAGSSIKANDVTFGPTFLINLKF